MNIRTKWCNFGLLFTVLVLVGVMALPAPMEAGEQRKGIRFVGLRDGDVLNSGSNTIRVVVTGGHYDPAIEELRFYIECTDERCNAIGKQLYPELSAEHGNLTEYVLEIQPDTCEWWSPRVMLAINLVDVSGERPRVLDLDRVCVYAHREE